MVGEKAVSLALGGLAGLAPPVEIGVRPRREAPLFHTLVDGSGRGLGCPELVGSLVLLGAGRGGLLAAEGGRWLIETARTSDWLFADVVAARRECRRLDGADGEFELSRSVSWSHRCPLLRRFETWQATFSWLPD